MSVIWCPQCKLPLTANETTTGLCPLCAAALHPDVQPIARAPAIAPSRSRWPLWAGLVLLLSTLSAGGLVIAMWPRHRAEQQANKPENKPASKAFVGPPEELKGSPPERLFVGPPAELKGQPNAIVKQPPFVGPPGELKVEQPLVKPVVIGDLTKLDDPNGEYTVDDIRDRTVKLTGRIKTLKVSSVNSKGTLDASGLEAKEIIFLHEVDGGSTVKVNAPGGCVEFRAPVNGHSKVDVQAPNGTVEFLTLVDGRCTVNVYAPNGAIRFQDKCMVNGESQLTLTARSVEFHEFLDGSTTYVRATLTDGGVLLFKELRGGVKIHYRKANPKDAEINIVRGDVKAHAEVKRIE